MEIEPKKTTANKALVSSNIFSLGGGGLTCADRTRVIGILEQANSHLDPASSLTLYATNISIEKDY
jgi:hypothetical protein